MQNLGGQTECIMGNWKIENKCSMYLLKAQILCICTC